MGTTRNTLERWFDEGVAGGHKFMAVFCDTFDWDDYPTYYDSEAEAQIDINKYANGAQPNMAKLMEVYILDPTKKDEQMAQRRSWVLRPQNL